jgi:hypothetical protein
MCFVASPFPKDALTFDDLLQRARERLVPIASMSLEQIPVFEELKEVLNYDQCNGTKFISKSNYGLV